AESELRRSEERLRLAAAAAGFGVYEYTIETGSAYYSPELLALFGLPTGALPPPGADLLATTLHPDDRTAFLSQMNAANDPQRPGVLDLEFRIRRPDGETRWLRLLGRTTCLDSGGDARPCYVSGIIQDVTERRSADEKIREREETYRSVIENSLQGFAIMQDGRIVLCNDELCRMDGYTKEETYGMTPAQVLATVHAEEREVVIEAMRAHAIGGDPPPAAVIRLLRKDGGFRWVEVLTARSKYRERPAIQLSYLDLTEKRRAEAAYRSLIDHAINGIAILQDGRIKFANQGLADIYGYTIAELLCLTPE